MQKKVTDGTNIKTTDYLDGFQYNQNLLEFFPHSEGYVKVTLLTRDEIDPLYGFNYVYNYTDHLGNVRVSYTKDPQTGNLKILDEAHYYPFGLKHQKYATLGLIESANQVIVAPITNNPFKYAFNNKEFQDELGLNMHDFGARNYDPAIGRWMNIDPLADKYTNLSPYNFVMNNVVNAIDPDGRLIIFVGGLRLLRGNLDQRWYGLSGFYKTDIFEYWQDYEGTNSYGRVAKVDNLFMEMHSDRNVLYTSGSSDWNSSAADRMEDGRRKAKKFYRSWKKSKVDLVDGEAIRIVSHSQGGAHAAGFADQLRTYKDENGESIFNIEVIYYITPHQSDDITSPKGIVSFQFGHPSDAISGEGFGLISLFNGGKHYGRITNVTRFFSEDIFGGKGQPPCEGPTGNKCAHNVTDNRNFLLNTLNEFCGKNPGKCKTIELVPENANGD